MPGHRGETSSGDSVNAPRHALALASRAFLGLNDDESEAACQKALDIASEAGDEWGQAEAHRMLALWHDRVGSDEDAIRHGRLAVGLFDEAGDQRKAADTRFNLSDDVDFDEAVTLVNEARGRYEVLGMGQDVADCDWRLGGVHRREGHLEAARDLYLIALEGFIAAGAWEGAVRTGGDVNLLLRELGDVDSARLVLGRLSVTLEEVDVDAWPALVARARMGALLHQAGMPVEALRHLDPVTPILLERAFDEAAGVELHLSWREERWLDLTALVLTCRVEALALVGRLEEALSAADTGDRWAKAREFDLDVELGIARSLCYLNTGRGEAVCRLLIPMRERLVDLPEDERSDRYERILGVIEQNLAAALATLGEAEAALAACDRAQTLLDRLETRESLAAIAFLRCLVAREAGLPGGELDRILEPIALLIDIGAQARATAMRLHLADLLLDDRENEKASIQAAQASEEAAQLGLTTIQLVADSIRGLADFLLAVERYDDDPPAEAVDEALEHTIPAFLGIGAARLMVRDVQIRSRLSYEFSCAADRAATIAQFADDGRTLVGLVETARMFGVLERDAGPRPSRPLAKGASDRSMDGPEELAHDAFSTAMAIDLLGGQGTLTDVAGDIALAAPPMLLMPWGDFALAHFHDLAEERYGVRMASSQELQLGGSV